MVVRRVAGRVGHVSCKDAAGGKTYMLEQERRCENARRQTSPSNASHFPLPITHATCTSHCHNPQPFPKKYTHTHTVPLVAPRAPLIQVSGFSLTLDMRSPKQTNPLPTVPSQQSTHRL